MKRPIINQSKRVTPRVQTISRAYDMIGKVTTSNVFPTFKGRLIHVEDWKCYFEIIENKEYTKYNHCAGQIEYLPEEMVVCMKFEEEEEEK